MDPVTEAVRRARAELALIPKAVLVDRMIRNTDALRSLPGVDQDLVRMADEAIRDASGIETEADVIGCVRKWIDLSSRMDGTGRDFSSGLGSLLMRVTV